MISESKNPQISILILTHNAPEYVKETLQTLQTTKTDNDTSYEVIVVDNASEEPTKNILKEELKAGHIDKLNFSEENLLFAKGNNTAAQMASASSRYFLLLNSDVSIRNPEWLIELMNHKKNGSYGVASFGITYDFVIRSDGYCYLIDRKLYEKIPLDENFPWWWGITKQQACILQAGIKILAIANHNKFLVHYGGKSGIVPSLNLNGKFGSDVDSEAICEWFGSYSVEIFDYQPIKTKIAFLKTKIARFFMAWPFQLGRRIFYCLKEHGLIYMLKRIPTKIMSMLSKK